VSEYEYEYDDGGGGFDPVAVDDDPGDDYLVDDGGGYSGPSQAEWEAAQAQLAKVSELADAVEWKSRQEQAAQMYAQRDDWLGDPSDDPAGYAERVWQIAQETAEARLAPFEQWFSEATQEFALQQADVQADELIAGHADRLGVELDAEASKAAIGQALDGAYQQLVANGMPAEEAYGRVYSPEGGQEAIRLYAELIAREQAMRGGDETALVSKYFSGPRAQAPRPARAQYRDAQHRAVAEQALRGH
jgi:hypothetical protein